MSSMPSACKYFIRFHPFFHTLMLTTPTEHPGLRQGDGHAPSVKETSFGPWREALPPARDMSHIRTTAKMILRRRDPNPSDLYRRTGTQISNKVFSPRLPGEIGARTRPMAGLACFRTALGRAVDHSGRGEKNSRRIEIDDRRQPTSKAARSLA